MFAVLLLLFPRSSSFTYHSKHILVPSTHDGEEIQTFFNSKNNEPKKFKTLNRKPWRLKSSHEMGDMTIDSVPDPSPKKKKRRKIRRMRVIDGIQSNTTDSINLWPSGDALDRRIAKLALPTIANFAMNPLIGAVDLFWIGRMGNALALAGIAAANQVFNSAFFIVSYLPSVTATRVSKEYARRDRAGVQDAIAQTLFVGILMGVIGNSLLFLMPKTVLGSVLNKNAPAMPFAQSYLSVRALAFLPSLISNVGYSAFRGVLDNFTPLRISLTANIFNAILDPILIFNSKMGVTGAALASLGADLISATLFTLALFRRRLICWSKLLKLPKLSDLGPLFAAGSALFLRNMAINVTFLAVTRVTQRIDTTGVAAAAHSIAMQVFYVGGIVLLSLSKVAQTLVPNEIVPKKDPRTGIEYGGVLAARVTVNRMMAWGFLLGSILGAFQLVILPFIHKVTPLPEVQLAARYPSFIACALQIINGLVFIGEGVMVGCGNFLQLSISTVIATIGALYSLYIFPATFGLTGVWMSFGVFNMLRLAGVWFHQTKTGPIAERNIKKNLV